MAKQLSAIISGQWSFVVRRISGTHGLAVILIAYTLLGLLYDFTVPLFEKPDELKHFAVIQHIQTRKRLPVVQAGVYKPWDQEGTQPPLYHILAAGLTSWLDLSGFAEPPRNPHYADERSFVWRERGNNNLYLHPPGENLSLSPVIIAARLARWLSLVCGLLTVWLTYRLARLVFGRQSTLLPLTAAALVAFIPQFLHVNSAITNDSLAATLAALALVALLQVVVHGRSPRRAAWVGVILGLAALTKLSLLYLAPLAGLVWLADLRRHRRWRVLLADGLIIGGLAAVIAGWWFVRNWLVYGDPTALNAHLLYRGGALNPTPSLGQIWREEMTGLELSFWAAFGAGQILLEPWLYAILRGIKYVVLAGLLIGLWRMHPWHTGGAGLPRYRGLPLLGLWAVIIYAALIRWMQITPASWGRLLYPALPAMAVLAVWGLSQIPIPRLSRPVLPLLLAGGLFGLALVSPFRYILAAYGKAPLLTETDIPTTVQPVDLVYDDTLRLIGFTTAPGPVHPGEWLAVTLYWQALHPTGKNYSTFVHALSADGQAIGQSNSYPDRGNWATSFLPPGAVLPDRHFVPLPADTPAPAVLRLAMGIFEFDDPARTAKPAVNREGQTVQPIAGAVPVVPRQWSRPKPSNPVQANFAGQIRLLGYDLPQAEIKPGETVSLTLYWETLAPPAQSLTLFIQLIDPATGAPAAGFDAPPAFDTRFWQTGYLIPDSRSLVIPADLPPDEYRLTIGWYRPDTLARLPLVDMPGDALSLQAVTIR